MSAVSQVGKSGSALGAVAVLALVAGCGGQSPTTPAVTPPVIVVPPPPPPKTPPTIASLSLSSPRVEADDQIVATAVVEDADTPLDKLKYEWSATPVNAVFAGEGTQVRWTAPHLQTTPDLYTLTLTVTKNYTDAATGEAKEFKVSKGAQVHYNDSWRDITRISMRFLTELFPNFSVTPQQAVQDFSDNCPGKFAELEDVRRNRSNFRILSGKYTISSIELNADKTFGTVRGLCVFEDIPVATGKKETVTGICTLTAVYEDWKWLLCDSHYAGITVSATGIRFMR